MDPLSITASIITVLEVTSKVLSICYEYKLAISNASKNSSRVIEEVVSLRNVLETLAQLAEKVESADSTAETRLPALKLLSEPREGPLAKCLAELEALKQELAPLNLNGQPRPKRKALIGTLGWPLKEKDTIKSLQNIERFKATLALAITADQTTILLAIEDLARTTQDTTLDIQKGVADLQVFYLSKKTDDFIEKVRKWLSPPDPSSNYQKALDERHEGTGVWFIESKKFAKWRTKPNSFLWLHGKPGSGKSVLAATIIENIKDHCGLKPSTAVAFFYFDFADNEKQPCGNMIRSLITQLSTQNTHMPQALASLYSSCSDGQTQPSFNSLLSLLREIIEQLQETLIIVDALDECKERDKILAVIEEIIGWRLDNLHILATSRKEPGIEKSMKILSEEQERIGIQGVQVNNDICAYIHNRIRTDRNLKKWQEKAGAQQEIEETLISKADGMFRWVACQLDSLGHCMTPRSLRTALKSLPETLDETYARILCSIDEDKRQFALRLLQWLTFSARPITLAEVAEAIVVDVNEDPRFDMDSRFLQPTDVLTICSSLVTTANETEDSSSASASIETEGPPSAGTNIEVQLAHFSVKEYLVSTRIRYGPAKVYSIEEGYANASMSETCLAYLLHFDKSDSLTSQPLENFPLILYAASYWAHHARLADSDTSIYPLLAVELLMDKKYALLHWVRLCDRDQHDQTDLTKALDGLCPPLYYAARAGLIKPVELLLFRGADVNAYGERYCNALRAASSAGHQKVVQLLLEEGADFNTQGDEHGNALIAASSGGHKDVVQLLLDKGADVNALGGTYGNALQAASYWGHEDIMRFLIDEGADVNTICGVYGSVLQTAAVFNSENVIQLLLDNGADVNAPGGYFGSPLAAAIGLERKKVMQLFFANGAHIGTLDKESLENAGFLFKIEKCSDSCMRRKLTSTLKGDVPITDCELCQKIRNGLSEDSVRDFGPPPLKNQFTGV